VESSIPQFDATAGTTAYPTPPCYTGGAPAGQCTQAAATAFQNLRGITVNDFTTALYMNPTDPASFGDDKPLIIENLRAIVAAVAFYNGSESTYPYPFTFGGPGNPNFLNDGLLYCLPRHVSQTIPNDNGPQNVFCGQCNGDPNGPHPYPTY